MSILFCFSKKTQLFHFSNKVFSLVVHWGMKVMGMTKKNVFTIRKLHWRKSQRVSTVILALLCFPCFKNLIFKFKKMKHFAWIFEHGWKNDCNDEKTAVQCLMYENNWNWWTRPCVSEQRSSASLTLKLKKVWNRWLTTQQLEHV